VRLPSDTQPYFLLVALVGLAMRRRLPLRVYPVIYPFAAMLVLATVSLAWTLAGRGLDFATFRSFFGYLSSFIALLYLYSSREWINARHLTPVFDFCVGVTLFGFLLNLTGLNWVVRLLVNRAEFRFDGLRGLVSFFSEQSHMVTSMSVLLYLLLQMRALTWKRALILLLVIIASGSGQAVIEIFLFGAFLGFGFLVEVIVRRRFTVRGLALVIVSALAALSLVLGLRSLDLRFRAFEVFKLFSLEDGLRLLGSDYSITWKVQGVFLAIATLIATPFVFQLSALTSTDALGRLYDAQSAVYGFVFGVSNPRFGDRVYSAFGTWIVDFGILGLVAYALVLSAFLPRVLGFGRPDYRGIACGLFVLYVTLAKVPLASPVLWLLLFAVYHLSGRDGHDAAP
jgi:hypothetical protein